MLRFETIAKLTSRCARASIGLVRNIASCSREPHVSLTSALRQPYVTECEPTHSCTRSVLDHRDCMRLLYALPAASQMDRVRSYASADRLDVAIVEVEAFRWQWVK